MPLPYSTELSLLSAASANVNGAAVDWGGGRGVFAAFGTFGGGTVTLQWTPDGGTDWLPVDASGNTFTTLTAAGAGGFELPACQIRAVLAGATSPSVSATAANSKT